MSKKLLAEAEKRRQARLKKRMLSAKKNAAKNHLSTGNQGIGHEMDDRALDRAKRSEPEFGYSIPEEIEDVVRQAEDNVDDLGGGHIQIPPALVDKVKAVADIEVLADAEDVEYEMIHFGAEGGSPAEILQAGAHWVLFANGDPVARVDLANQDERERIAGYFVTDNYAKNFTQSIHTNGLMQTLAAANATPYVAVIDRDDKLREERKKLKASFDESLRDATSKVKATLMSNAGLVVQAMVSNFIVENPLKDALVRGITAAGVPLSAANKIVDDAYLEEGQNTFNAMLDKADEWSNTPAEAMATIAKAIKDAGVRTRPLPEAVANNENFNHGLAARMSAAAVPVAHMHGEESHTSRVVDATFGAVDQSREQRKADLRARGYGFRRV